MSGVTFPVMTAVSLWFSVLFLRKVGITFQKGTIRYFAGIQLLGISTMLTDNGFFHFFNSAGIILLFMMAMAHQVYQDREWGFTEYVKKFFIMLGTWIVSVGELFRSVGKKETAGAANGSAYDSVDKCEHNSPGKAGKNTGPVLIGILAARAISESSAHDV